MKGKREEPRRERSKPARRQSASLGDPFAEDRVKPQKKSGWAAFWASGKGKILAAALGCLAVFVIVVAVVLKMWVKPPEIPVSGPQTPQNPVVNQTQQDQVPVPHLPVPDLAASD